MRTLLAILITLAASNSGAQGTVADLVTKLQAMDQSLSVKVAVGRGRILASVDVEARTGHEIESPGYMVLHADAGEAHNVAVLYEVPRIVPTYRESEPSVAPILQACNVADLALEDVSCNPPHGFGPDGRAWFHIVCGEAKGIMPYDWQLFRLSGNMADIFAWNFDPRYAYAEGEAGDYQAAAYTLLGEFNYNKTLPVSCDSKAPAKPRR